MVKRKIPVYKIDYIRINVNGCGKIATPIFAGRLVSVQRWNQVFF